ncbi:MAG TPA: DUF2721 domain-containing protein [Verrucomicrobiae bacterium]
MRFSELVTVLQLSVSPVILISGVGLLLLSMTNRFGRVIDRIRLVADASRKSTGPDRDRFGAQLQMLRVRAKALRLAIILAVVSMLMAALLVITLFITAATRSDYGLPVIILFLGSMLFLISSLAVFIQDLNLSLAAVNVEIGEADQA